MTGGGPPQDIVCRLYREGDEGAILELLHQAFGRWPRVDVDVSPEEHLRWKLRLDVDEPHVHCLALAGSRLAGFQSHLVQTALLRGNEVKIIRGWDACVHQEDRARGVMTAVRAHVRETLPRPCLMQVGAFTDSPAMLHVHVREGRLALGAGMRMLTAPLTVQAAASVLKLRPGRSPRKLARAVASLLSWLAGRATQQGAARPSRRFVIRNAERFDERVDAFAREVALPFDFIHLRTREYVNWRYGDRRAGGFTIKLAEEDERLVGYAVLRSTNGHAYIADLIALPGRDDVVLALAHEAIDHFRRAGASAVECMIAANHPYRALLRRCGFAAERKRKVPPSFLPIDASPEDVALLASPDLRFHLMIGDADVV